MRDLGFRLSDFNKGEELGVSWLRVSSGFRKWGFGDCDLEFGSGLGLGFRV